MCTVKAARKACRAGVVFQVAVDQYGRAGQVLMAAAHLSGIPHAFVLNDAGVVRYHGHPAHPEFEKAVKQVCTTWFG